MSLSTKKIKMEDTNSKDYEDKEKIGSTIEYNKEKQNENIGNINKSLSEAKNSEPSEIEISNESQFQPADIKILSSSESFDIINASTEKEKFIHLSQGIYEENNSINNKQIETLKIILLGENNVGKTNIISRFVSNSFKNESNKTTEVVKYTKTIDLDIENKTIIFEIWDTPGQEIYKTINKEFYRNAQVIILVYDINNKLSFDELQNYWIYQAKKYSNEKTSKWFIYFINFLKL